MRPCDISPRWTTEEGVGADPVRSPQAVELESRSSVGFADIWGKKAHLQQSKTCKSVSQVQELVL